MSERSILIIGAGIGGLAGEIGELPLDRNAAHGWSFVALAAVLCVLSGTGTARAYDCDDEYVRRCRGFVVPCSLDGVNPAYHPSIFGNPALAKQQYGFLRSPDGSWHVEKNCVRGLYHGG